MTGFEHEIASAFVLVYAALFPVVNPLGVAPIFLSLTSGAGEARRRRLALNVAINSFLLLLGSMVCGSYVLQFFGITIPAVRVAGGALVASMGWSLLHGSARSAMESSSGNDTSAKANEGFYPLTLPLTVGPGAISVALTLGAHHASHPALNLVSAIAGLCALVLTIYLAYRFAASLVRYLGDTGVNVLLRLSAFILVCIGVQIAWGGLSDLIGSLQGAAARL